MFSILNSEGVPYMYILTKPIHSSCHWLKYWLPCHHHFDFNVQLMVNGKIIIE